MVSAAGRDVAVSKCGPELCPVPVADLCMLPSSGSVLFRSRPRPMLNGQGRASVPEHPQLWEVTCAAGHVGQELSSGLGLPDRCSIPCLSGSFHQFVVGGALRAQPFSIRSCAP